MIKSAAAPKTVDDYIGRFPPNVRALLTKVRTTIKAAAPTALEKISYQMPTFYLNGNLVHFAAHPQHLGFYPTPSGITAFQKELTPYKSAKGSVQFPLDESMPLDLIRKIVEFRVKENSTKGRTRR